MAREALVGGLEQRLRHRHARRGQQEEHDDDPLAVRQRGQQAAGRDASARKQADGHGDDGGPAHAQRIGHEPDEEQRDGDQHGERGVDVAGVHVVPAHHLAQEDGRDSHEREVGDAVEEVDGLDRPVLPRIVLEDTEVLEVLYDGLKPGGLGGGDVARHGTVLRECGWGWSGR